MKPTSVSADAAPERCGMLLGRLGKLVSRRFAKALSATGLKPPQAGVLITLRDSGPMTQQALGDVLHIDPSNLVGVLNELEDNGWAIRRRDPTDRRRHIVEISAEGADRVAGVEDVVAGVEDELLAVLNPQEREQLRDLVARIVESTPADEALEMHAAEFEPAQAASGAGRS
jgi:DNA-binding MarR family transcriptional regulator